MSLAALFGFCGLTYSLGDGRMRARMGPERAPSRYIGGETKRQSVIWQFSRNSTFTLSHRNPCPAEDQTYNRGERNAFLPLSICRYFTFPLLLLLRLFVLFVPAVCIAASSKAQDKLQEFSKVDIFGGYSYVHMVSTSQAGPIPELVTSFAPANLNGWNGSLEYKPIRWLGAVADFGGAYGTEQVTLGCEAIVPCPQPPFRATAHVHSVLFGPRLSVSIAKATPFVQGLVGVAHTSLTGPSNFSDTAPSWAIGGGLDYRLLKGIAWRIQADGLYTGFFGKTQNNFRLSTGVVFHF